MIVGIGTDIVKISRICPDALLPGDSFWNRNFTEKEREQSKERGDYRYYFASRFAGKEAVFKAISFCKADFAPQDIEITDKEDGRPFVTLAGKTLQALSSRIAGTIIFHISLSKETEFALAFAVLETD